MNNNSNGNGTVDRVIDKIKYIAQSMYTFDVCKLINNKLKIDI